MQPKTFVFTLLSLSLSTGVALAGPSARRAPPPAPRPLVLGVGGVLTDPRAPAARDAVLVLLSSKDVNAVRTTQGKFQFRDEIKQRINSLLPKPGVRSAYFTDFVVQ